MNARWVRIWIAVGALLVLAGVNLAIAGKERIARNGQPVYLALAPVDPRSLLQGDHMALGFALSRELGDRAAAKAPPREGDTLEARLVLDANRVGRLAPEGGPATLILRYRIREGRVWLGTNAFFFPEGSARRFADARYGEFRVDPQSGEAVLVGLRDAALRAL